MGQNTSFIGSCPSSTVEADPLLQEISKELKKLAKARKERGRVKENIKATVIKQAVCSKCKKTILTIYTPQWRKAINKGIRCVNCKTKFTVNDIER